MRPQAVLFDLDGTLLNTMTDLAAAGNHTRAAYGLPPLGRMPRRIHLPNRRRCCWRNNPCV